MIDLILLCKNSYLDEILWREWFEHGNKKAQNVFVAGVLALEEKVLVVEDYLTVHIFNEDPEGLRATVDLLVPLEVGSDGELNLKGAPENDKKIINN